MFLFSLTRASSSWILCVPELEARASVGIEQTTVNDWQNFPFVF